MSKAEKEEPRPIPAKVKARALKSMPGVRDAHR